MAHGTMHFPPDFRWGTATSSHQVEGNNLNNDWWTWEQTEGHILDQSRSATACNWWENAESDLDRAAALGTNAHRMSIEWSRIEPEPSQFDRSSLERYRQILQAMIDRGIEPMVTLHHFTLPRWLVEKGDFDTPIVVDYFQRYTRHVVEALGDLVTHWVTINEPIVFIYMRYLAQQFPPPTRVGQLAARNAFVNLLRCHAAAYHEIKELQPSAQVGVAKNSPLLEAAADTGRLSQWWTDQLSWLFNDAWMDSMMTGRLPAIFGRRTIPHLANSFDFVGINYYSRYFVRFPKLEIETEWGPNARVSDGNYGEMYPQGIFQLIKKALRYNKPIFITENGVPDAADTLRSAYLISHLREIWRAISFCFPVMGYYHWSLVDNFEWERGWTQRFGLYALNVETQTRTLRSSGQLYQEICTTQSLTSQMIEQYAPELMPTLFPG